MRRRRARPDVEHLPRWQAIGLYTAFGLLLVSGLLWIAFHYGVRVESPFGPRPHWLEYQWLRVHGFAAMLALVAFGSLIPIHVRKAWATGRNRTSGLAMIMLFAALALSGYLLYYFTTEQSREWIGVIHWGVGLGTVPALGWHVLERRRRRARNTRSTAQPFTPVDVRVP